MNRFTQQREASDRAAQEIARSHQEKATHLAREMVKVARQGVEAEAARKSLLEATSRLKADEAARAAREDQVTSCLVVRLFFFFQRKTDSRASRFMTSNTVFFWFDVKLSLDACPYLSLIFSIPAPGPKSSCCSGIFATTSRRIGGDAREGIGSPKEGRSGRGSARARESSR